MRQIKTAISKLFSKSPNGKKISNGQFREEVIKYVHSEKKKKLSR